LDKVFPFFHGKITRKACEELLCKNGKNGSYLIRESESVEGALCLCVFLFCLNLKDSTLSLRVYLSVMWGKKNQHHI
uniref:SH2 domain-containing protein n=1 Tax=Anser cygnoides TaxID=8845 RepID=A0A8B9D3T2_ANSCY